MTKKEEKEESVYAKFIPKIKDLIYITAMVIAFGGWVISQSNNKVLLKENVRLNTEAISNLNELSKDQAATNTKLLTIVEHLLK